MTDAGGNADAETFVSWREFLGSPYAPSLALVCLAVWLHAADSLIVATMMPAIVGDIGGAALIGWSVSLYETGSIVAGAASALLTMRYGLRGPMSLAAALFAAGCVLSAISPTMPLLLAGRALQGLGGGGLVSMGFVAVGVIFPRRYTARTLAAVSTLWGVSAFLGPLIGGLFVEYANWRLGFGFFATQAFALSLWIAARSDPGRPERQSADAGFPLRRLAILSLAIILVASGGVEIDLARTTTCVAGGLICLAVFIRLDRNAAGNRLFPLRPFDPRHTTGAALLMILSMTMATIAMTAFGPLLIIAVHGVSPLAAGYTVAFTAFGWTIMALVVSGSPERLDRRFIAIGMVVVASSTVGFVYAVPEGPVWLIALLAAIRGGGFGMAWTFILRRVTASCDPSEIHRVSGAIPTVQRLGYALGAAYLGIVANASGILKMETPAEAADVTRWIFLACLPFAGLGLFAMTSLVRGRTPGTVR